MLHQPRWLKDFRTEVDQSINSFTESLLKGRLIKVFSTREHFIQAGKFGVVFERSCKDGITNNINK